MKKEMVATTIAVLPMQAAFIRGLQDGTIDLEKDSLRIIAEKCGDKSKSPQKVAHHMRQLLKLGILQYVNAQYVYIKPNISPFQSKTDK